MSDRSEPYEGEPDIEIGNHFQLRLYRRRIHNVTFEYKGEEEVLQYRTRQKQSECWSKWMDLTVDFEGEPPAGSY